ncbi:MAG: hypothetical protein IT426_17395 [Pirellulales bacterium]|nr:hypothetical protein [Pirellulales bacterium]
MLKDEKAVAAKLKNTRGVDFERDEAGHLAYVDFTCANKIDYDKAVDGLQLCPYLRSVDCFKTDLTDVGLGIITQCENLQKLIISECDRLTVEGISKIRSLQRLQELHLNPKKDADLCMKYVSEIKSIRHLILTFSKITDDGLKHVGTMPNLEWLDLSQVETITGRGLKYLVGLPLRELSLSRTIITDEDMVYVGDLSGLETLFLNSPNITDKGIKHLARLKRLKTLFLCEMKITDNCLPYLCQLKELDDLALWDTEISDAGLKLFQNLKKLKSLHLGNTKISIDGARFINWLLPKCDITTSFDEQIGIIRD